MCDGKLYSQNSHKKNPTTRYVNEMGSSLGKLVFLDLFAFFAFPRPRKDRGQTGSALGVVGTFLLIAIMVGYCLSTFLRWWEEPPTSSVTQRTVSTESRSVPPVCWTLPHINNKSYYGVSFRQLSLNANAQTAHLIDLPLRPYNATQHGPDAYGRTPQNTVCFDPTTAQQDYIADQKAQGNVNPYMPPEGVGVVYSFCNPGLCTTLKFKVFLCGTPDHLNPANPTLNAQANITCQNVSVMAESLETNYLRMEMHTHIGNVIENLAPKVEYASMHNVQLMYNENCLLPDLMRTFWESTTRFLTVYSTSFALIYSYANVPRGSPPPHEVSEVNFLLASFSTITTNSRGTLLDLIGKWGAFFGVVFAAIGLVAMRYNMWKFYYKHPKWGRLDHNMQPAPSDLDYSASSADDDESNFGGSTRSSFTASPSKLQSRDSVDPCSAEAKCTTKRVRREVPVFGHSLWYRLYRVFERSGRAANRSALHSHEEGAPIAATESSRLV
jgi:hypothetical protein